MKNLINTCLFPVLLLLALPAVVHAQFGYSNNGNGTCTITSYTGSGGAVIIPTNINNLTVTSIVGAFKTNLNVTSVTIPTSVTNIGTQAFEGCLGLRSVIMGNGVQTIGDGAFAECGVLNNVTIPDSVTSIGDAFVDCYELTSMTIPNSVTNIGGTAFYGCTDLTTLLFLGNAPPGLDGSYIFGGDFYVTVYYTYGTTGWGATFGGRSTALWNPHAISAQVSGGQFGFVIAGPVFETIVVEAATNLADPVWIPVSTNTLVFSGVSTFSDPQSQNYSTRYYRFRLK